MINNINSFTRLLVFIVILFASNNQAFGYDSLRLALNLHQSSQYQKALPVFINLSRKFLNENDISNYALCQLKIADIIRNYGGNNVAIELLKINEKLIELNLGKEVLILEQNFKAIGEAFYSASRLTEFKQSIHKSILLKRQIGLPEKDFIEDYFHLARYYKEFQNQNDSCYHWARKALAMAKTDPFSTVYILPKIYNLIGSYYHPASGTLFRDKSGLLKLDSMSNHFVISRKYYDSAFTAMSYQEVKDELLLARLYHNLGNSYNNQIFINPVLYLSKAIKSYRRCLSLIEKYESPTEMALEHWVIGVAFYRGQMNDSAICEFQKGILKVMPNFKPANIRELPKFQPTLSDDWFTRLFFKKAEQFYVKYRINKNREDLFSAYEHYLFLLKFNNYLISRDVNEQESSYQNHLFSLNGFQTLAEISFELYEVTGEFSYLRNSYSLLSKSKYAYLNSYDMEPVIANSINQTVLRAEIDLVKRNIQKSIPTLSMTDINTVFAKIKSNNSIPFQQINLMQKYDSVSVEDIQQLLSDQNSVLIDFYWSDPGLYTIIITKDSLYAIKRNSTKNLKSTIWKIQNGYGRNSPDEFALLSNNIFQETLDSALILIPKDIDRLIICPDNFLQNIPWDALVVDIRNTHSFKELDYLLYHYTIRTILSPRLLYNDVNPKEQGYCGIGPSFNNSRRFTTIPFSAALVKAKAEKSNGIFNETLLKDTLKVDVLHIASHVVNDSLRPYNSSIYFNDKDSITISQLSNIAIKPRLVILNGCQTGKGTYYQSEGTISFARAFYRLGAESVLMTLWSVDDKTTANILEHFYQEMEKGYSLDLSLRNAKLGFIKTTSTDELANPFYWAGLQLSGNAEPIYERGYPLKMFYVISIILAITIVIYLTRMRKARYLV